MSKESLEWVHYESYRAEKKVLLIGDSIVWGAHRFLDRYLPKGTASTTLVTAHGVNEPQFLKAIVTLATLNDGEYEAVYFNNGLHHRGQSADEYEQNYRKALQEMMRAIPAKAWILGLSTPVTDHIGNAEQHTTPITAQAKSSTNEANDKVFEYNQRVQKIATELGVICFDAYSLMADHNHLKIDPYHFNDEGREIYAQAVANVLTATIKER